MKTAVRNNATINQEINRIFRILTIKAPDDMVVVLEKARKGYSCSGMISILSREDMQRQEADKGYKATPIARYAFYPDGYFPTRLGSVAIYGNDAVALCSQLKCRRKLFGITIIDAVVEYGKRPFVDVRLKTSTVFSNS